MTETAIANKNCTVSITETSPTTATVTIVTPESTTVKADGAGVYAGDLDVLIAGATDGVCTQTAPFPAIINPSSTKTKADGDFVILEGDEGDTVDVVGVDAASAPCTIAITPIIESAGQDKVLTK